MPGRLEHVPFVNYELPDGRIIQLSECFEKWVLLLHRFGLTEGGAGGDTVVAGPEIMFTPKDLNLEDDYHPKFEGLAEMISSWYALVVLPLNMVEDLIRFFLSAWKSVTWISAKISTALW